MNKKEQKIIDFMKSDGYIPMKAKEIAYVLGVTKEEYTEFVNCLKNLEDEYKILKNRKNKYRLRDEKVYEGLYRKNAKGFGFVKLENQDEIKQSEEIYISKSKFNECTKWGHGYS